jgi:predicted enzyme related to lactoylglutathione lyase
VDFNSVLIGSEDPARLVAYYTKLFGDPPMSMGEYTAWNVGSGWITIGPHSDVKGRSPQPGRIILNFETADVKGDFERFKAAGAVVVADPYTYEDEPGFIATFEDPDGNYFQLMSPMDPGQGG